MDDVYKQVMATQSRLRGYLDEPNNSVARQFSQELQRLLDEIESQKNAQSLEDRVKSLLRQLQSFTTEVMDDRHVDDIKDRLEDVRSDLQKLG